MFYPLSASPVCCHEKTTAAFFWILLLGVSLTNCCSTQLRLKRRRLTFVGLAQPHNRSTLSKVETLKTNKYLRLQLDNKLDWCECMSDLYRRAQSRLYCLWRLQLFHISGKLRQMFHQSAVASVLFYAVVCWGGNVKKKDALTLDS